MTLLAPLGLLAGLLAVPVLVAHVLRPMREREVVSSTMLWRTLEDPVAPSRPWQRLRWSLPLLLQLLLVALLALALAQPARTVATSLADHTVFIVDTSASMLARDGDPDRVESARQRVHDLVDDLPAGGSASLVVASGDPDLAIVDSTDRAALRREIDRIRPSTGIADFDAAFTLAESVVSGSRATGWVLVSDGGIDADAQRLAPPGMRLETVGDRDVNRAVTALSVVVSDGDLLALVTLANTGGPAATQPLRIDVDGVTVARREVTLPPGEVVELSVPIPIGSRVEAFLDGDDLLPEDNQRATLVPLATDLRIRIATDDPDGSYFVEEIVRALGAEVVRSTEEADLVVYDGIAVPAAPTVPFISIASPTPPPGVTIVGEVERPVPTFLLDDPVLRDVDVTSTAIASAQLLDVGGSTVLIGGAEGEPLLVEGRAGDVRWFHVAFELERSNLPVDVAYPILFSRLVGDLTINDEVPASAVVGSRLPSLGEEAVVTGPRGVTTRVAAGSPMPLLDRAGFWTVENADGELRPVAVVFPSEESSIAVTSELAALAEATTPAPGDETTEAAGAVTPPGGDVIGGQATRSLVTWVIAAALVVLVLELLVSWRRRSVPKGQLVAARAVRLAVVLALVGALVGLQWTRSDPTVRAVIVHDLSDSLGADGTAEAAAFVSAALAAGDVDQVAVVEVGRTVHVAKPFDAAGDVIPDPPGDGTDLVRGLRLAGSLLDGTTRERIVVVSDGLDTAGGLAAEIDRLAGIGIQLDVHRVGTPSDDDVAVVGVRAPSSVSADESYSVTATVVTAQASSSEVELVRGEEVVASRRVDLEPGENEVVFDVTADEAGVDRWVVRLVGATDPVPQNDVASTAVSVEGPPVVLVVEEDPGEADLVAEALEARALDVERVGVDAFPTGDDLAAYGSVVLVDIEARSLNDDHLDALDLHVRERGNGLVVVGGTESFALGGYAETRLEDLLPIESRAEDPTRKATVAEVLLIDASESMGACHCAPIEGQATDDPFAGQAVEGGVNKTQISRAAAERAIAALSSDDEVGVLAFSGEHDWIVPLQSVGSAEELAQTELARLSPGGETRISPALDVAAEALRESAKELKHIILFSDGFTPELFDDGEFGLPPGMEIATLSEMEEQAEGLAEEGITVSVVATGEGAAPLLEQIAIAGNGRFYPGRDLDEIPEIFVEEARIASRNFINEGSYVPTITSTAAPVRGLDAAPPLSGFLAATAKDTTDVMLQVGEFSDPVLSSWRVGLGKVTAWTSDAGTRWAADWAAWDGWADFWSTLVRDTFPLEGASGIALDAQVRGGSVRLELASEDPWPAGAAPTASVTGPDGDVIQVELERTGDTTFGATVPAAASGSYSAVAVSAPGEGESEGSRLASAIATRSYPTEYLPGREPATPLDELSALTGGRGEIAAGEVLDAADLTAGSSSRDLRWILLLVAALLFPLDVVLHRVRLRTLATDVRTSRHHRRGGAPHPATPTP